MQRGLLAIAVVMMLALAGCATTEADSPVGDAGAESTPKKAEVKTQKVRKSDRIPFATTVIKTDDLAKGETQVQQQGRAGVQVRVVRLTKRLGETVKREVLRKFVSREPVTKVLLVGTRVEKKPSSSGNCDPNYSGACVPVASDVDCAGGDGDGPAYVQGPVTVVGEDIYDLNRDPDNIACDS